MSLVVSCSCGRKLQARPEAVGKKIRCPVCSSVISIPDSEHQRESVDSVSDKVEPTGTFGFADDTVDESTKSSVTAVPRKNRSTPENRKAESEDETTDDEREDDDDARDDAPSSAKGTRLSMLPLMLLMAGYFPFLAGMLMLCVGLAVWGGVAANRATQDLVDLPLVIPSTFVAVYFGITALCILWSIRVLVLRAKDEPDRFAIELPDQWQEKFIDHVEKVARDRGLPMPDVVRLHAASLAHVYQDEKRRQVLVVGGLAVAAFPQRALAGIIAHELSHFGGDTSLSRLAVSWHRVIIQLEYHFWKFWWLRYNPAVWPIMLYHLALGWAWGYNSRGQEYAADRNEVRQVGKRQAAASLVLVYVFDLLPYAQLISVAENAIKMNERLDGLFKEQVSRLKSASYADWEKALKRALAQRANWYDSHPTLKQRLDAMGVSPKKALKAAMDLSGDPAADLFVNWPVVEKFLTDKVLHIVREYYLAREEFQDTVTKLMRL